MKFFRALIKAVCVILVICLTMTAIFFRKNGVNTVSVKSSDDIRAESVCADITDKSYKKIAESGFLQLFFDKETTALMIKDTSGGKKWYSMPNGTESANVLLTVTAADGNHIMNSQGSSVNFSAFSVKTKSDGVNIKYIMADSKTVAQKKKYQKKDIVFAVSADFTLKDGNFFAESEIENLSGNENCAITDFSLLPFFGSFKDPKENDFLLIPDGCGATALPYYESSKKTYSCKVYGDDIAVENKKSAHASMGVFGMKRGENAFAAIINSSEEFAEISAVSSKKGFSSVAAHFAPDYVNRKDKSLYIYKNSNPSVSICYKFLSKGNATYSDIASACREQLIRNGTLSTSAISNCDEVPMSVILTGAYKNKRWDLKYESYTTFSQAEDILKRIKAKGVNNISVRYSGVFEGNSVNIIPDLGGKNGLQELASFTDSQNIKLYLDLDVLTFDSAFGSFSYSAARKMNKIPFSVSVTNGIDQSRTRKFRPLKKSNKFIDSLISKTADYPVTGYCFADSGRVLSSDFSASGAKRTEYKEGIISQISAVSGIGEVMTDTGNIYTVKGSSEIINIPMTVSNKESRSYRKIPFVQSVLHGMCILSSTALNVSDSDAVLRCIEYGLCPTFTTVYQKPEGGKDNIVFDKTANSIVSTYTNISEAIYSLEGERITSHAEVKDGVFCTSYSNSTRIYVNYSKEDVTVNGVKVPARGYIRID